MSTETRIINYNITLTTQECCSCGNPYGINKVFLDGKKKRGGNWWCPYCGVSTIFAETDCQRLERELKESQNRCAREIAEHDQTRASLAALKGVNTQIKNRISKGVCPCCKRYFNNLHRHMKSKHSNEIDEGHKVFAILRGKK